jgi:hypothetical protein
MLSQQLVKNSVFHVLDFLSAQRAKYTLEFDAVKQYQHSEIRRSAHRVHYVLCTGLITSRDYSHIIITKTECSLYCTQWILNVFQFDFSL